jgi:hypothetical protein
MTETEAAGGMPEDEITTHQIAERMVLKEDSSGGFRLEPIPYQPGPFKVSIPVPPIEQSPRNARMIQHHRDQHVQCCKLWRECERLDDRLKGTDKQIVMSSPTQSAVRQRKCERAQKLSTLNLASTEISREQWLNGRNMANRTLNRNDRNVLRAWFKSLDVDGSGNISMDELMDPLLSTGSVESALQVRDIVNRLDINNDGELDFRELMRMFEGRNNKKMYGKNFSGLIDSLQMVMPPDASSTDASTDKLLPMKVALGVARRRYLMDTICVEKAEKPSVLPSITGKKGREARARRFSRERQERATQKYLCNTIGGIVERHMEQVRVSDAV